MKINMMVAAAGFSLAVLGANCANAATFVLDFTQVGIPSNGCCGAFDVAAKIQATPDGANYDVQSITGTVTQNGTPFAITGLISAPNDPGDYFAFDNTIIGTGGSAPFSLDSGGIGFYAAGINNFYSADPSAAFNVYDYGGGALSTTASYDVNTTFNGTYSISAVPEPAIWTMMVLGVGMVGAGLRMSGRKDEMAIEAA